MKTHNKITFAQTIIIVLCTILIITTNYIFSNNIIDNVREEMLQNEYKKMGGKDNYKLLQEIQKQEMMKYLENIKKENPELLYNLRQKTVTQQNTEVNLLSWEAKNEITPAGEDQKDITVIEFSDFECPYCVEFHNESTLSNIIEEHEGKVHYSFKNFPLPDHDKGQLLSLASKCVEKLSNQETYQNYVHTLFQGNTLYGEEELQSIANTFNVGSDDFSVCMEDPENKNMVNLEFEQGRKLGISVVPSTVIIDNKSGMFEVLSGKVEQEEISNVITQFLQ